MHMTRPPRLLPTDIYHLRKWQGKEQANDHRANTRWPGIPNMMNIGWPSAASGQAGTSARFAWFKASWDNRYLARGFTL